MATSRSRRVINGGTTPSPEMTRTVTMTPTRAPVYGRPYDHTRRSRERSISGRASDSSYRM